MQTNPITHPMKNSDAFASEFFSYIRLAASYIGYASYICSASDIALRAVIGEYNITETVGFNIAFCEAKYITPSKTEYHYKLTVM